MSPPSNAERRPGGPMSDHELARRIGPVLCPGGEEVTIEARRICAYRSTFPIEELLVRLADGSVQRLVLKDLSAGAQDERLEASFLRDPLREIEVYRDVLQPNGITAPGFRGAIADTAGRRYWLLLEHLDAVPLWQLGEAEAWLTAARWLAELHARFEGRIADLPRRLLVHDEAYYRRWLERTRSFVDWEAGGAHDHRRFDQLAVRYLDAARWLVLQPRTFLHGEFYPSNVMVEQRRGELRIRPLDWEMAGVGPGLLDLAALTSGAWLERERVAMAEAYRASLPASMRTSDDELRTGLDQCRLLLSGQWLGWSAGWRPPSHHAHDWLATALELAGAT